MSHVEAALDTWRAAECLDIGCDRLAWPRLGRLVKAARELRSIAPSSSIAQRAMRAVFAARRILTSTPLPPVHPLTALAAARDESERFISQNPTHSACVRLRPVVDALTELLTDESPVAQWFIDVVANYGADVDGRPQAVIVVPRKTWVEAVREWAIDEELDCVDVAAMPELRQEAWATVEQERPESEPGHGIHQVALLAGHPGQTFRSWWQPYDTALSTHAWLFTAPPARQVRVALLADAPRLAGDSLWLFPEFEPPALEIRDHGPHGVVSMEAASMDMDWTMPRTGIRPERIPRPRDGEEARVEAFGFGTADGRALFFHPTIGPRPHVVTGAGDEEDLDLVKVSPSAVQPGNLLAVRVGGAPHGQLVGRADRWLEHHKNWSPPHTAEVRQAAHQLKTAMRTAKVRLGPEALRRKLERWGLRGDYARTLMHNLLDTAYIAPRRREDFHGLVKVLEATHLRGRFDEFAVLRTAHQRAGEEIRDDLLSLLQRQRRLERVERDGWTIVRDPDLGVLLVTLVVSAADARIAVPQTWLGVPIEPGGEVVRSWEPERGRWEESA